ncbi:HNH endonuclease signature motif containing protein [Microbacterium sp. CIAB417]|uniref:HNH endonuclease signature motif containing protein n=1 Tax=Microbacterium sp. CIAB417 TaxID=2860287 RepID=UPI001FAC8F9A|nr:HNH endonuclease signature motif containing protein [Microbacterium sp. CIAB417]
MDSIVARLRSLEETLDAAARDAFSTDEIQGLPDAEVAELLTITGRIQRRVEGLQVEAADVIRTRSEGCRDEKMTAAYGCSRPVDLVRLLTGSDTRAASRLVKASRLVNRIRGISDGEFLPPSYPAMRTALTTGAVGVSGLLAATGPLEHAVRRIADDDRLAADEQLAALACGLDPDERDTDTVPRPAALPEDLETYARVIVAYLDPDGAEPSAQEAARSRFLSIGRLRDGCHALRGSVLPEVAAQLMLLLDSVLGPRADVPGAAVGADGVRFEPSDDEDLSFDHAPEDILFVDDRTRAQKLHDAFATILDVAAAADALPHVGGAAPTLVVTATAEDLARGSGWGTVLNTGAPVPLSSAFRTGCAGGIQRVLFDESGRIASIGTSARIFNALQRRAITVRDGGCIIPGCTVPATWCEVHHVREHADGGPTHTDNGVLLCWWHHRSLHLTEWTIRMNRGVPEVRGPAWWDPHQHWHRARSPHRRRHPARAPA